MKVKPAPADKSTFGSEARRLRINCLLTQQDLADLASVSCEQVNLLEHNYPVPLDCKRRVLRELWAIKARK